MHESEWLLVAFMVIIIVMKVKYEVSGYFSNGKKRYSLAKIPLQ